MILLQILTGRRASEIRTCDYDCLSPAGTIAGADGDVTRFRYAQSKIDIAPDTILVDREVTAIIGEQRAWLHEHYPDFPQRFLFVQRSGNRRGSKPYASGSYNWMLREFSDIAQITDSTNQPVGLSHTHRFRHTRFTRLAELGLPVHVLQRYAGHATPTISMHYVAQREEHAA
jgi:integrase